jgi:uncharacterized repeat protein (TIGR01451 family)
MDRQDIRPRFARLRHLAVAVWCVVLLASAHSWQAAHAAPAEPFVPGEVLVKLGQGTRDESVIETLRAGNDVDQAERLAGVRSGTLWRLRSRSRSTEALVQAMRQDPRVVYAEPNYIVRGAATPNDPSYTEQWGLKNVGQSILGSVGVAGSDIHAEAAWNVTTGSRSIVIGVVDSGIDYNHPDLSANLWANPGGVGRPGCAAGTHGFNAITSTCDPMDDHFHGTHVAGTIGAVGNNGIGVAGVNWTTSIMALKFLDQTNHGTIANAIVAIDFAIQAKIGGVNLRVLNNSWGGSGNSNALRDVIQEANDHDILFVIAAMNDAVNLDVLPTYPASFNLPNTITVAAIDNRDALTSFSNYGPHSVHLAAPGFIVLSTMPGNSYAYADGTSMACPHVSGVAALILANAPGRTTAQVKSAILDTVDPVPKLAGKTVTGGRLNAARAIGVPAGPDFTLSVAPSSRLVMRGNATSYVVTIVPTGGFAGAVALSVDGLPSGASASFTANPATTTSTLVITTTAAAQPGTRPLSITGLSGSLYDGVPATLLVAEPPVAGCSSFLPPLDSLAGVDPAAIATADFNRDGIPDLAVAAAGSNGVFVVLGEGDGGFGPLVRINTGPGPRSVIVGDFNADAKTDLAVANSSGNSVSVALGNGDGTFQFANSYLAGANPRSLAAADLDRDGDLDLAVVNSESDDVSILFGQGNGSFGATVSYATASGPVGIIVANLNGDLWPDLAVAAHDAGKVSILTGNAGGAFSPAVQVSAAGGPTSLAGGDFNGDGKTDLAVSQGDTGKISILRGNGNATFQAAVDHPACSAPTSVAVFDAEGDGKADLAVTCGGSDQVAFLSGTGTGTFASPLLFSSGMGPASVVAVDVDGDTRKDLAVASSVGLLSIHRGFGTCSDLTIAKSHAANFVRGDGQQYTIVVSNPGAGPTTGAVSVTDTLPPGLTTTAMSGAGWTCIASESMCARGDVLGAGASYPPITLTVNVAGNAAANVTNVATVAGGGEVPTANDTAMDPTTILPGFAPPSSVTAKAATPTSVTITWSAPSGSTPARYNVYRSSNGTGYALVGSVNFPAASFLDGTASAGAAYLYKVRSAGSDGGNESTDSNRDLAVTVVFTDDPPLAAITPIKAVHIAELRVAVNAVRALGALGSGTYTDPALTPGVTPIRRAHIADLRAALDAARSALALPAIVYGEPLTAAVTPVRKAHLAELRAGVQ